VESRNFLAGSRVSIEPPTVIKTPDNKMVILETAAITAGGYAAWRGGEAAVKQTKNSVKNFKREQRRGKDQRELDEKIKERKERQSRLESMRQLSGSVTTSSTTKGSRGALANIKASFSKKKSESSSTASVRLSPQKSSKNGEEDDDIKKRLAAFKSRLNRR